MGSPDRVGNALPVWAWRLLPALPGLGTGSTLIVMGVTNHLQIFNLSNRNRSSSP